MNRRFQEMKTGKVKTLSLEDLEGSATTSSLGKVIKSKKEGELFMKMLKSL